MLISVAGTVSTVDTVFGIGFYVVLVLVGNVSVYFATRFTYLRLRERGLAGTGLTSATILAALLFFMGLWLFFDIYRVGLAISNASDKRAGDDG